jgi:hypothetical protein
MSDPGNPGTILFAKIKETMDSVRPMVADATKMISDFGQLVLKTCITLNGGGFIGFPTFFKALAPAGTATPRSLFIASGCFAVELGLAAIASLVALIFVLRTTRMVIASMVLPMIEAQNTLLPQSMTPEQHKLLTKGRRSMGKTMASATIGTVVSVGLCGISVVLFLSGGVLGGLAVIHIMGPR